MKGIRTGIRLTTKERILVHLLEWGTFADAVEVLPEMTQNGVAKAAGIDLRHFTQYARPLLDEQLVQERTAHVKGSRQRRKVYSLTGVGRMQAVRLRERLKAEPLRVRDGLAVRDATLGEVLEKTRWKVPLLQALRQAEEQGILDLAVSVAPARPSFVEMLSDVPRMPNFIGRQRELGEITSDEGPPVLVVRGIAGIGKTALAAQACDRFRGRRNLYWHAVRPWDTRLSLLAALGDFLAALGKPGLRAVVQRGNAERAPEVLREDLGGTGSFLVYDDVHEAGGEALQYFRLLAEAVAHAPGVRVLALTREKPRFYDRREVALKGVVEEIELAGLASEEVGAHLAGVPGLRVATPRSRQLFGLPLFLELVRAHGGAPSAALRDVNLFLEEEVYAKLSGPERRMLKMAALYRVPVPADALLADPDCGPDSLSSLVNQSLLRRVGESRYEVHETIRDFVRERASADELQRFGPFAVAQLRRLASEATGDRRFAACAAYLSNALQLPTSTADRVALWEELGDATRHQGDLLASLVAYREAAKTAADSETRARMHRRVAVVLLDHGEVDPAMAELEAGLRALANRRGPERGWLELGLCRVHYLRNQETEAWNRGQNALAAFRGAADSEGLAHSHFWLANVGRYATTEDHVVSIEHHLHSASEQAKLAEDLSLLANIHCAWAIHLAERGKLEEASGHLTSVESIPGAFEDVQVRRRFLEVRSFLGISRGGAAHSAARADCAELLRLSREVRDAEGEAQAKYRMALIAGLEGKPGEARPLMSEVVEERLQRRMWPGNELYWAGVYSLMAGDLGEFRRNLSVLGSAKPPPTVKDWPLYKDILEAFDCLTRGEGERAVAMLAKPLRTVEGLPKESRKTAILAAKVYLGLFVILRAQGRDAAAEEYRRRAAVLRPPGLLTDWELHARLIAEGIQNSIRTSPP